jgi:hypothetical protein
MAKETCLRGFSIGFQGMGPLKSSGMKVRIQAARLGGMNR